MIGQAGNTKKSHVSGVKVTAAACLRCTVGQVRLWDPRQGGGGSGISGSGSSDDAAASGGGGGCLATIHGHKVIEGSSAHNLHKTWSVGTRLGTRFNTRRASLSLFPFRRT
jgi:hypothetical protein